VQLQKSGSAGQQSRFLIRDEEERGLTWWERWVKGTKAVLRRFGQSPIIPLMSLLASLVTCGVLVILIFTINGSEVNSVQDEAQSKAVQLAESLEDLVKQSVAPAQALSVIIYEDPNWSSLKGRFRTLAAKILSELEEGDARLFATLEIAPDTIIQEVYPYDGEAEKAIGLDLYNHPLSKANATVRKTIESKQYTFQGPLTLQGLSGPFGVLVRYPVFVPVTASTVRDPDDPTRGSTLGDAVLSAGEVPPTRYEDNTSLVYNTTKPDGTPRDPEVHWWPITETDQESIEFAPDGTVFWGFSIVVLDWTAFLSEVEGMVQRINKGVYKYRIYRPGGAGSEDENFTVSERQPRYNIAQANVELPNETWTVEMGLSHEYRASWFVGAVAASAVVSLVVGILVLLVLLSNARHVELLEAMLPRHVIKALHRGHAVAESFPEVVTLFTDIVGYTRLSAMMEPAKVLSMLNDIYALFDDLCDAHGVYKLETIGDAYIAVAGATPGVDAGDSTRCVADLALDMVQAMKHFPKYNGEELKIRVGLHVGPLVAGVVGSRKPKWTLLGDTMNTGSRMESTSDPMRIQCSEAFKKRLEEAGRGAYLMEPRVDPVEASTAEARGELGATNAKAPGVYVKGKGHMVTYWLVGGAAANADTGNEAGGGTSAGLEAV